MYIQQINYLHLYCLSGNLNAVKQCINTNSESIDYKFIQENAEIDLQISAEFS